MSTAGKKPTFVCNVTPVTPSNPVKKPAAKRSRTQAKPFKYIDVAGGNKKYKYLRFRFMCPTIENVNNIIGQLYTEKIADWTYVTAEAFMRVDENGEHSGVSAHGIARIPNSEIHDWGFFRKLWPNAYFKLGCYPENSYPLKKEADPAPLATIPASSVPAPIPVVEEPNSEDDALVVLAEGSV